MRPPAGSRRPPPAARSGARAATPRHGQGAAERSIPRWPWVSGPWRPSRRSRRSHSFRPYRRSAAGARMDGSGPVEAPCVARTVKAQGIRITLIVVNREPRPFNDLAGFSDYGMTGTLDVGVRTPMLRCTLRAGRMARSRRAVEAVNAAGEPSRLLSAPRSPARAGFAGGGARMAASYAGSLVRVCRGARGGGECVAWRGRMRSRR